MTKNPTTNRKIGINITIKITVAIIEKPTIINTDAEVSKLSEHTLTKCSYLDENLFLIFLLIIRKRTVAITTIPKSTKPNHQYAVSPIIQE